MTTEVSSPVSSVKTGHDPLAEYRERLAERQATWKSWSDWDQRLSTARGILFVAGLICTFAIGSNLVQYFFVALPFVAAFLTLVIVHGVVSRRLQTARRAVHHYELACQRVEDEWRGHGATGSRYLDPAHPYASDLDLFGDASLFQLINQSRTRLGEDRLARWLSEPAEIEILERRQGVVQSLLDELDLREQFAVLDAAVHDGIDQKQLSVWAQQPPDEVSRVTLAAAWFFGAAALLAVLGWMFAGLSYSGIIAVLLIEIPFLFALRHRVRDVGESVQEVGDGLKILSQVLSLIEQHRFDNPYLAGLQVQLQQDSCLPSQSIARLDRHVQTLNNCMQNQFLAPIALLLCLPIHLIHKIESWRSEAGRHIPEWLDVVGEVEAFSSIAGFSYEHPDYPFPEVTDKTLCFIGTGVGHPLIPPAQCVRNDIELGDDCRLVMVSGSNMSGKSTMLRTIGVNVALALAGAPVCAESMRLSVMQLGTAMRVSDSLQDGKSLFYAVISRLKSIVDLTSGTRPLLFLLDEILQGTNSHDRRIGAEGVIRCLLEHNAIGVVTTHDLALTKITEQLPVTSRNAHFEDRIVDGRMEFDYQMRDGVVERSNALELMRLMGLQV